MIKNIRSYEENMSVLRTTIAKMSQDIDGVHAILTELTQTNWEPLFQIQRQFHRNCLLCNVTYRVHTVNEQAWLCTDCRTPERVKEINRVFSHQQRAKKHHLLATLTVKEWLDALDYFDWKCAYCQKHQFVVIEHFLPISLGGGTTANNCVPACKNCNKVKSSQHPEAIKRIPQEAIQRVKSYLDSK